MSGTNQRPALGVLLGQVMPPRTADYVARYNAHSADAVTQDDMAMLRAGVRDVLHSAKRTEKHAAVARGAAPVAGTGERRTAKLAAKAAYNAARTEIMQAAAAASTAADQTHHASSTAKRLATSRVQHTRLSKDVNTALMDAEKALHVAARAERADRRRNVPHTAHAHTHAHAHGHGRSAHSRH
eukprot:TRINITY_DN10555_c0_g4_i1.p2 TRINITY_DN10555_c0_g4~~TRINITY_DN10555_c0_g4_i1.p2  ORF type:complete len:184 (+),score=34.57 TRINITY_DN10555_c0_g4_i1:154-705(+)